MQPKLTVSGYRGIWPETLNKEIVSDLGNRFAQFIRNRDGKKILIGRDGRTTGPAILDILLPLLTAKGLDVTDAGILPTPSILFLVRKLGYDGAIIITASHNPIEWNGLKFVTKRGLFTTEEEVAEIQNISLSNESQPSGSVTSDTTLVSLHIHGILEHLDVEKVRSKKFKVVVDTINGAGGTASPLLLKSLGTDYTVINGTPDGNFAHPPEPIPQHLKETGYEVARREADIGFVQDPDADRLVLIDETGEVVSEEMTVSLAVLAVLKKRESVGPVVVNMSTTRTVEDIAEQFGKEVYRTKVGEANVVSGIERYGAIVGGEGSGGVIYPKMNMGRDSLAGMALILELLAEEDKPLSKIVASIPRYVLHKEKWGFDGNLTEALADLASAFPEAEANHLDGLRLDFPDSSWIHVRPSNTEPVVRLIGEGKTEAVLKKIVQKARRAMIGEE